MIPAVCVRLNDPGTARPPVSSPTLNPLPVQTKYDLGWRTASLPIRLLPGGKPELSRRSEQRADLRKGSYGITSRRDGRSRESAMRQKRTEPTQQLAASTRYLTPRGRETGERRQDTVPEPRPRPTDRPPRIAHPPTTADYQCTRSRWKTDNSRRNAVGFWHPSGVRCLFAASGGRRPVRAWRPQSTPTPGYVRPSLRDGMVVAGLTRHLARPSSIDYRRPTTHPSPLNRRSRNQKLNSNPHLFLSLYMSVIRDIRDRSKKSCA